jgi:hypothetical protein
MKILSHTSWGGEEQKFLKIHRQLVRAKLDYGKIIYKSAKIKHQKIVNTSINTSIRLAIGVFRSSPVESIRNLELEPPPQLRQIEKSPIYVSSITRNTDNTTNKYIDETIKYAK